MDTSLTDILVYPLLLYILKEIVSINRRLARLEAIIDPNSNKKHRGG